MGHSEYDLASHEGRAWNAGRKLAPSKQRRDAMSLIEPFFVNRLSTWNDGRISNGGTDKCGGIS
jgi:hypothetical protein